MLSDGGSHGSAHRLRFDSSTDGDGGTHGWAHRLCEESLGGSHGSAHRLLWPHRLLFGGEADIVGDIVGVNGTNMGAFAEKVGVEAGVERGGVVLAGVIHGSGADMVVVVVVAYVVALVVVVVTRFRRRCRCRRCM